MVDLEAAPAWPIAFFAESRPSPEIVAMLEPAFEARFEKSRRSPSKEPEPDAFFRDRPAAAVGFFRAGARRFVPAGAARRAGFFRVRVFASLDPGAVVSPLLESSMAFTSEVASRVHFSPAAGNTGLMSTGMSLSLALVDSISAFVFP